MSHDSRAHVELSATAGPELAASEVVDEAFRILILGDFSGRPPAGKEPLTLRTVWRVDRDGIDAAMEGIVPEHRVMIDPSGPADTLTFRGIDDFHPDSLLVRAPMLVRLRALRDAMATQRGGVVSSGSATVPAGTDAGGAGLLDRILANDAGASPPKPRVSSSGDGDELSELIHRAVRPHLVDELPPEQAAQLAKVDDAIAAYLRVLLHDGAFQALEAAWRGVDFLMRRLDREGVLEVGLLDLDRDELASAVDGDGTALNGVLAQDWTLVLGLYSFGLADIGLLRGVASIAAASGAPWISAAAPGLAGADSLAGNVDTDDWRGPSQEWELLRRESTSSFVALALPRFLLRLPYGTEAPVDAIPFDELVDDSTPHESFLWGHPAFPCALVAASEAGEGEAMRTHGTVTGLPLHFVRSAGSVDALPCAEARLSERAAMHLLDRGLTPLVPQRDGDAVRVSRLQSIAFPSARLSSRKGGR